ncbi:MAG: O-antigen ligase family protein, partial [Pirellulaceae bacterium]
MAAFVNLLWPLALVRLVETRDRAPRLLLTGWLLTAGVILYFTSSRGGWLGALSGLLVISLLSPELAHARDRLMAKPWRVILAAFAAVFIVAALVNRQGGRLTYAGIVESRLHFWTAAWDAFTSSPVVGTGPLTYGESYLATHSVPPDRLYSHTHSFVINLTTESGLIGLAGLAWLTVTLVRSLHSRSQRRSVRDWYTRLGVLAALVATAVHSQVDSVPSVPYICILLALLLAILLKDDVRDTPQQPSSKPAAWVLPLGLAILLAAAAWSLRSSLVFSRGARAANAGDWSTAAARLHEAARRDPHHAYYQLQAGYADGRLSLKRPDHLARAITHYRVGISRSPNYAINAANLSALLWEAGEAREAVAWMERAV